MSDETARATLDRLIRERGGNYGALSRLIGRNPAYIQQYIKRGTPRRLQEDDRRVLARFLGVDERLLGAPLVVGQGEGNANPAKSGGKYLTPVPRLRVGASAGAGSLDNEDESATGAIAFDPKWFKMAGLEPASLSIIQVDGESMSPTLNDGDDIMVDHADAAGRLRDGLYVLRLDDVLMVKRVALVPRGLSGAGDGAGRGGGRGRWRLCISSDNPHFPSWDDVDPAMVAIVGRVVWAGRRLR